MSTLEMHKLQSGAWKHVDSIDGEFFLGRFSFKNEFAKAFLVEAYGAKRREYVIANITVYDYLGTAETFTNFTDLINRLVVLGYTGIDTNNIIPSPVQVYKTISVDTPLDNTYHNAVVWVTATCNITIPTSLRADFNCTFRTFAGATATFIVSGTTINSESDGDVQAPSSMSYLAQFAINDFIISGGDLS